MPRTSVRPIAVLSAVVLTVTAGALAALAYGVVPPWTQVALPGAFALATASDEPTGQAQEIARLVEERKRLVEQTLALKVANTTLETDLLIAKDRLNRITQERERAGSDAEARRAEVAQAQRKLEEAAAALAARDARIAELEGQNATERARADAAEQTTRELAENLRKSQETVAARAAEPKRAQARREAERTPATASAPAHPFLAALTALATAVRADRNTTSLKNELLKSVGTTLSEREIEQHLGALTDKKLVASWTKYGDPVSGLAYVVVTKVVDNRFVGVVNLSFGTLLNGQAGPIADAEAIDVLFPVEVRAEESGGEVRVSWFYDDGNASGVLGPPFPAAATPWTMSSYLLARARSHRGQNQNQNQADASAAPATKIFATGGQRTGIRPISLADFEKKLPLQFARFSASIKTELPPAR